MATSSDRSTATSYLTGYLLNVFLHGVLTVQSCELFMRLAVYVLYATETAQTVLVVYLAFVDLVVKGETSFNAFGVSGVVLGSVVAFIFEMFYAFRIILLSRRRWLTGLASVQLGTGIWVGAVAGYLPYNIRAYLAWFGVAALCDATITTAMITLLIRNDKGLSTTRRLTKRVLKLTVESGAITTIATILCITLIASTNGQLFFVPILQSLPKLYSNSLLVQLNSRSKPYEIDLGQLDPIDLSFVKSNGGQSHPHHFETVDIETHQSAAGVNLKDDEPPPDFSPTETDSATLLA
ncbi:hypothetical protein F5887DRAFT_1021018 [Amanita rubescens]|nr:hypothetical protein F5887DRAFT_1021018 [Amanita rubescens]